MKTLKLKAKAIPIQIKAEKSIELITTKQDDFSVESNYFTASDSSNSSAITIQFKTELETTLESFNFAVPEDPEEAEFKNKPVKRQLTYSCIPTDDTMNDMMTTQTLSEATLNELDAKCDETEIPIRKWKSSVARYNIITSDTEESDANDEDNDTVTATMEAAKSEIELPVDSMENVLVTVRPKTNQQHMSFSYWTDTFCNATKK